MEQLDNERVAQIVDNEGLGYAVQHYMGPEHIADPKLREMWRRAAEALNEIDAYLEDVQDPEDDDEE